MRISDWSSDVCSSDLANAVSKAGAMGKKLTHRGLMAQFLTRWPLKTGKLGKMKFDRIIQQPPTFLVKEHHRDRCDRLGHRINAIARHGPNLSAVAKVTRAVQKALQRQAMPHRHN